MIPALPPGQRVLVTAYADDPEEAVRDGLLLEPQPAIDPANLQPGEALLRIRSASVTWVHLLMTSGQYQHMVPLPYTPGMEYAGEVLATGPGVDPQRCAVGDRMLADGALVGPRSHGAYQRTGGLATYAVLPAEALIPIPGALSFDEATVLLQAYETAYHCLIVRANLQPGESILINGASGVTGLAAVQVAKLLGATVIAAGRSDAKLTIVKTHGADHLINICAADGHPRPFRDEVKALTGGQGVDVVYDAVGGDIGLESLRSLAFGGRFLIVGWTSTPDVARGRGQRGAPKANQLPTNIIQMKNLSVLGCPSAIAATRNPALRAERRAVLFDWAASGKIRPFVSHAYPLADFRAALMARWTGEITGGCVVHPA